MVSPAPGAGISLYEHALCLHARIPDGPLEPQNDPFPEGAMNLRHAPRDRIGIDAAEAVRAHLAWPDLHPRFLGWAVREVAVPIFRDERITEAVREADPAHARRTGRWLVRRATDVNSVLIGLALLLESAEPADIPLVQTVSLYSETFGPLAYRILERLPDATDSLLWAAERSQGWGLVYAVKALLRQDTEEARQWLLRRPADGDIAQGYFAHAVLVGTRAHEEVARPDADPALVDNTGLFLLTLTHCRGMGTDLLGYAHARVAVTAFFEHVSRLGPTSARFRAVQELTRHLHANTPERLGWDPRRARRLGRTLLAAWAGPTEPVPWGGHRWLGVQGGG